YSKEYYFPLTTLGNTIYIESRYHPSIPYQNKINPYAYSDEHRYTLSCASDYLVQWQDDVPSTYILRENRLKIDFIADAHVRRTRPEVFYPRLRTIERASRIHATGSGSSKPPPLWRSMTPIYFD